MTYRSIKWPFAAILTLGLMSAHATSRDSLDLQIHFSKTRIETAQDLVVDVQVKSSKITPVIFYKHPPPGFIERHMGALRVQMQSKIGDKYIDLPVYGAIDNMQAEVDTIFTNNIRTYQFSLIKFYSHLLKGGYRVRFLAAFSLENPGVKDKLSDWVYFDCENEIYP